MILKLSDDLIRESTPTATRDYHAYIRPRLGRTNPTPVATTPVALLRDKVKMQLLASTSTGGVKVHWFKYARNKNNLFFPVPCR